MARTLLVKTSLLAVGGLGAIDLGTLDMETLEKLQAMGKEKIGETVATGHSRVHTLPPGVVPRKLGDREADLFDPANSQLLQSGPVPEGKLRTQLIPEADQARLQEGEKVPSSKYWRQIPNIATFVDAIQGTRGKSVFVYFYGSKTCDSCEELFEPMEKVGKKVLGETAEGEVDLVSVDLENGETPFYHVNDVIKQHYPKFSRPSDIQKLFVKEDDDEETPGIPTSTTTMYIETEMERQAREEGQIFWPSMFLLTKQATLTFDKSDDEEDMSGLPDVNIAARTVVQVFPALPGSSTAWEDLGAESRITDYDVEAAKFPKKLRSHMYQMSGYQKSDKYTPRTAQHLEL